MLSLNNLILLINQGEKELDTLKYDVLRNSIITQDVELNGDKTVLKEVENFDTLMEKYNDNLLKLNNYRNILTQSNSTVKLSCGITIIEAIDKVKFLNKKLRLLEDLCNKTESKRRMYDGAGGSSYYREDKFNFDIDKIKSEKDKINKQIADLEADIQNTNAITMVEIVK